MAPLCLRDVIFRSLAVSLLGRRARNLLNVARQGGEATDRIAGCRLEAAKPQCHANLAVASPRAAGQTVVNMLQGVGKKSHQVRRFGRASDREGAENFLVPKNVYRDLNQHLSLYRFSCITITIL